MDSHSHEAFAESTGPTAPCFWVSGEYLLWWVRQGPLPVALLTANPDPLVFPTQATQGTQVLFGSGSNNGLNFGTFSGGRITAGVWFDPGHVLGLEGSGFLLQSRSINYTTATAGDGAGLSIGIPFNVTNPVPGFPFGENALAFPFIPGVPPVLSTFQVGASTRLYGAEANFVYTLGAGDYCYCLLLVGFRNLDLRETLSLGATFSDTIDGVTESINDNFTTRNNFYGAQVGLRQGIALGRFLIDVTTKVALGNNHGTLNINGSTLVTGNLVGGFPPPGNYPGGVFTQPSNIGTFVSNKFSVVPEFQLQLAYAVNDFLSCSVGFNFLYATGLLRPGNQIDRNIDATQSFALNAGLGGLSPGPAEPFVLLKRSDFWATGLTAGVEFRY